jgi:hypothetical protein
MAVDVGKKIFIRGDAESGRSILPLNYECAARINTGKGADRPLICLDIAVASNSDPMTSDDNNDACGKKYGGDLLHKGVLLPMRRNDGHFWIQEFSAT